MNLRFSRPIFPGSFSHIERLLVCRTQSLLLFDCQNGSSKPLPRTRYNAPAARAYVDLHPQRPGIDKEKSYSKPAKDVDHDVQQEEISHYEATVAKSKSGRIKTPWHREGSEEPPVSKLRSASAMTKGKLLTTPSRLLKLILPLTTRDFNSDRKDVEPLALLVHPQQPLSYLERLIQAELPVVPTERGEQIPEVNFRAEDVIQESSGGATPTDGEVEPQAAENEGEGGEKRGATAEGTATQESHDQHDDLRGGPGEGGVESYSGLGHESKQETTGDFVRWSKSTEIGDFIRDAARGKEFAIEIQGAPREIRVGVPSFADRTYYLRTRLRKKARRIASMADVKKECDMAAHQSAQRVAYAGFGGIVGWMGIVAWLTFETNLGWDTMEPVTYLVGTAGIMIGYGWFLWNRREVSYQAAMNLTVSRRQKTLYESKGFDIQTWQQLIDEANMLRKEIKAIASEYDVDWDEAHDAHDQKVVEALKENRNSKRGKRSRRRDEDDEDEDEED